MSFLIPRELIPWYPRIDYNKCTGCLTCVNFCPHKVYDVENGKPKVARPFECVVGCMSCSKICPSEAITFPSMDELRRQLRELRKAAAEVSGKKDA
ncbi:MAG: ferredoxin family protein [archaeon YNP-LCB-003-016]|jgi:NAD-dependent dihydropyrimidine dehydrogenase PreA subunit|uniref:4Fe-4S dicluster domain-containing protein n=1 Tax=Candidatus Culexarchaeum yellowstonense TaxID=2928963 RepID=UPI0026F1654F|nr:ferredoxin family protein [Candidatus Culexarchaeum yellowstonense]MCR6624591.1 ferredoxin family protein [Candidatus Culexarchaeum yellowstonense]MCR6692435.1 ferredoxin family protein [Candidatus Culexarchaeum yellowstonense]